MDNIAFRESISFAQMIAKPRSPYELCKTLGIEIITDKPIHKDGYLVCQEGYKLIFVSSKIQNFDRRKFVISHEIGHFLLHRDNLYCYLLLTHQAKSTKPTNLRLNISCR